MIYDNFIQVCISSIYMHKYYRKRYDISHKDSDRGNGKQTIYKINLSLLNGQHKLLDCNL
jgi:acetoin utilization deacetylase AcuC-like enzyme